MKLKNDYEKSEKTKEDDTPILKTCMANIAEMTFDSFIDVYLEMTSISSDGRSLTRKASRINKFILPCFSNMKLSEITANDIRKWRNSMKQAVDPKTGSKYKKSYYYVVNCQMNEILKFAEEYTCPETNSTDVTKKASFRGVENSIWTQDQYMTFSVMMMDRPVYFYCMEIIFWCCLKPDELLALTPADLDFGKREILITKTFQHMNGKDIITPFKYLNSKRHITMPVFLCNELRDYMDYIFKPSEDGRLFPVSRTNLIRELKKGAKKAGLPEITMDGLRRSHKYMIADLGIGDSDFAERTGDESMDNRKHNKQYGPSKEEIAEKLNDIKWRWLENEE